MVELEHKEKEKVKDIFFYHSSETPYGCFSNFFICDFIDDKTNIKYISSEQYFMLKKSIKFEPENKELQEKILKETNQGKIKQLGRQVKNYNPKVWDEKRFDVMLNAIILKFQQNENLKNILIQTGNSNIYEASPTDNIWGIGFNQKDALKVNKNQYGLNLLGKALIEARKILKIKK